MAAQESPFHPLYPAGYPSADVAGNAASLTFFIPGKPLAKGRPRTRVVDRPGARPYAHIYTDENTRSWEDHVEDAVRQQLLHISLTSADEQEIHLPFRRRVLISTRFNLDKPASEKKSVHYPLKKPDLDNLVKAIFDALQKAGVLFNDNLITDMDVRKRFSEPGHPCGVEVDVTGLMH